MANDLFDVTIVGAGPAGLFGAYYAGFRGLRTKLIDSQPDLGGQVTALYPDKFIYDVGGFPKILGKDLVTNMVEQAMQYNPAVHLNENVHTLDRLPDGNLHLGTDLGEHLTKVVVITAGIGAFTPRPSSGRTWISGSARGSILPSGPRRTSAASACW